MYKANDVTNWLSQTTDNSKHFVWSPGLWDKGSLLYLQFIKKIEQQNFMDTTLLIMKHFIKTELLATEILCHLL